MVLAKIPLNVPLTCFAHESEANRKISDLKGLLRCGCELREAFSADPLPRFGGIEIVDKPCQSDPFHFPNISDSDAESKAPVWEAIYMSHPSVETDELVSQGDSNSKRFSGINREIAL